MTRGLRWTAIAAGAVAMQAGPATAQGTCTAGQVAAVQTSFVLASIPRYAARDSDLAVVAANYRTDLARQQGQLDSATAAYQAKAGVLPAGARLLEYRKLQDQTAEIERHTQELQQQLVLERQRRLRPIEVGVQAILDSIRGELHCAMIFDVGAGSGIASLNKAIDVTQRVIDRIKASKDTAMFGPRPELPGNGKP